MSEKKISDNNLRTILENKSILVAEDVQLNQDLVKRILQSRKVQVTIANNGVEALLFLHQKNFDCILMDVQMPEMDGIEATKQIRLLQDKTKASVPIIALTANSTKEENQKYLEAGMNNYLAKPYEESSLIQIIAKHLQQKFMEAFVPETLNNVKKNIINIDEAAVSKLYDLSLVESISGGDKEFIKKMITLFIETVPKDAQQLKQESKSGNWSQVGKIAHKLKSTIDSMAIKSIQQDIRIIESNAKEGSSIDILPVLIERIVKVIGTCVEQLQTEMEGMN
jgi:CheY-like chemotaxis protein/HPt (histidine-containing phosphotransfer) domain-containing protein